MTRPWKRLIATLFFSGLAAACANTEDGLASRTKNGAAPTTTVALVPIGPDAELVVVAANRPESAGFGSRVAIERGMLFASAPGLAGQSDGTVYMSAFSDGWSSPQVAMSSWDWRFGRDMAVRNLNVIASASESRSALFGNRSGAILVNAAPMNAGLINTFRLTGLYAQSSDDVGRAVAISDSFVAASGPMSGYYSTPNPYVAVGRLDNSRYGESVATVGPGDIATYGSFGTSLDMNDSILVVGADGTFGGKGSVFIYTRSGDTWTLAQRLDGAAGEAFGTDVDLVGSRMVVGAPGVDQGAVYVCNEAAGTWSCPTRLAHPNTSATGARAFGQSVSLSSSGNELVAGAPWTSGSTCCPGEAFTYELQEGTWTLTRSLRPTNPVNGDAFGTSVAIDAGVAVVGAPKGAGKVAVFGTPPVDRRSPRPSVSFDSPTTGGTITSHVSTTGGTPEGFIGTLTAWDRSFSRWDASANPTSGAFAGTWPNAESFYGSLTAYNANGYQLVSLSGSISSPPPTTITTSTSPASTSTLSSETIPSTAAAAAPTASPSATPSPSPDTVAVTASLPTASTITRPTASLAPTTMPNTLGSRASTTTTPSRAGEIGPNNSGIPTYQGPESATCQVRRPCTVAVPALAGATSASVRGAPTGLRFNVGRSALAGTPRKPGAFRIVVTASRGSRSGSVTVNLTVK